MAPTIESRVRMFLLGVSTALAIISMLFLDAGDALCSPARAGAVPNNSSAPSAHSIPPLGAGASDERWAKGIEKLIEAGKLAEARERVKEARAAQGDGYTIWVLEAKILFRENLHQESLKVLERCLGVTQTDPEVYKLVASNAILINRMDIAEQAMKTAVQLAPNDSLALFHLGALYYTDSRFPTALPVLEKSVSLNPDFVPARLFLGLALEELAQEQSAIESYRRAIEIAERSGFKGEQPYFYLGRLLYRQNKMNESLPYLLKSVEVNPQSCESLCLLSRIHSLQDRDGAAVTALRQCIQADPNCAVAHYLLSRAYVKQGRTEEAKRELSLFQDLEKREQIKMDPRKNQRANP